MLFDLIVFAAISGLAFGVMKYYSIKAKERVFDAINNIACVYDVMGDVVAKTNADRFVILYTSNGGGFPSVGSEVYSTIIYEYLGEGERTVRMQWQKMPVGEGQAKVIRAIENSPDGYVLDTSTMENSLFKDVFLRDGTEIAYAFKIKATGKKYFFGIIETNDASRGFDLASISMSVNKIRKLFKNAN